MTSEEPEILDEDEHHAAPAREPFRLTPLVGGMWEGGWEIAFDVECWAAHLGAVENKCEHCGPPYFRRSFNRPSGLVFHNEYWRCQRVVVAYNEGGQASTGVCLDCILKAKRMITRACAEKYPGLRPYACTEPWAHVGLHVARNVAGNVVAAWCLDPRGNPMAISRVEAESQ